MSSILNLIARTEHADHGDHVHVWLDVDDDRIDDLAELIADAMVRRQTHGLDDQAAYIPWATKRAGGSAHRPEVSAALESLLGLAVGLPTKPKTDEKLQAVVAEHVWHLLEMEQGDFLGQDVFVQGPSLRVEDHGADGLVIFQSDDQLFFRLWEIKKRCPVASLRPVVKAACDQLTNGGFAYLVQVSETIQQQQHDKRLKAFAARMGPNWFSQADSAHAGVSIKASRGSRDPESFDRMPELLPGLDGSCRRVGLAIESADLAVLARQVRDIVWTGL